MLQLQCSCPNGFLYLDKCKSIMDSLEMDFKYFYFCDIAEVVCSDHG